MTNGVVRDPDRVGPKSRTLRASRRAAESIEEHTTLVFMEDESDDAS